MIQVYIYKSVKYSMSKCVKQTQSSAIALPMCDTGYLLRDALKTFALRNTYGNFDI